MYASEALKARILQDGRNLGNGILKVDGFINHQVDARLMMQVGYALAARFAALPITKVVTAEISGIAPAIMTAMALDVPVVYARKHRPVTMPERTYLSSAPSHTKGNQVTLMVSPEWLRPADKVLIVDDFLASGHTIRALIDLVSQAGSELLGIAVVIEKSFEGGRAFFEDLDVPIEALVTVASMDDGKIMFAP